MLRRDNFAIHARIASFDHGSDRLVLDREIAFLVRRNVCSEELARAQRLASERGSSPAAELIAAGFDRRRYWRELARSLNVAFVGSLRGMTLVDAAGPTEAEGIRHGRCVVVSDAGLTLTVLAPRGADIEIVAARLMREPRLRERIRIAEPETIRSFLTERREQRLRDTAVNGLRRRLPRLSAKRRLAGPDRPVVLVSAGLGALAIAPWHLVQLAIALVTAFFVNCLFWKLATVLTPPSRPRVERLPERLLPTYTVLVPLYREATVVPDLLANLAGLDYPRCKLQVLVLLEADDEGSIAAVRSHPLADRVETIIVPPAAPKTKPKALSYAMPFARGDLVVVYDAEDRPEPDQLLKAAAAFHDHPGLGCVQARLVPDNRDSWLSRMFRIEYAANFEVILPALAAWRVPLPLGGTSNHFPRAVLEEVGGWDPFNVTEDADLGIRLARFGYRSQTISSRTFEEAPVFWRQWFPQRRRWIKGWMQTALVCRPGGIPAPLRLRRLDSLAVHGVISAGVLGLLLYPLSLLSFVLANLRLLSDPSWDWTTMAAVFVDVNLAIVVTTSVAAGLIGLARSGDIRDAALLATLPLYWLLMSAAAWAALVQLFNAPFAWDKTEHGVARSRRAGPDEPDVTARAQRLRGAAAAAHG